MKYEATVQPCPGCSVGLSPSSTCPSFRRSAQTWTPGIPFEANGTASSWVTRWSSTTICVTRRSPGAFRRRGRQHEERRGVVGARRVDQGPGGCTLYTEEMKNKHSQKGRSRLRLLMAAAMFSRYQWYLLSARLRSTAPGQQTALLGTGTCGNEALHVELRGIFRQAYFVTMPTSKLKLDLFKLSKQVSFDGARRIPMLRQMNQRPIASGGVSSHNGPRMPYPVPLCLRYGCAPPQATSWRGSWCAPCLARLAGRGTAVTRWPRGT